METIVKGHIVLPPKPDPVTQLAARELERYLRLLNSELSVTLQLAPAEPLGEEKFSLSANQPVAIRSEDKHLRLLDLPDTAPNPLCGEIRLTIKK